MSTAGFMLFPSPLDTPKLFLQTGLKNFYVFMKPFAIKNVRLLAACNFLMSFRPFAVIAIIYFQQITGSFTQAMAVFSVATLAQAALEDLLERQIIVTAEVNGFSWGPFAEDIAIYRESVVWPEKEKQGMLQKEKIKLCYGMKHSNDKEI